MGFGDQGQSAYEYWNHSGNEIVVCDSQTDIEIPEGAGRQLGEGYLNNLDQFDLVIRTPALHPSKIVAANSEAILSKVTTVTNEFFKVCPTKNIMGVTGTKGKGTTSTLVAKMLEATGLKVHLGGNIGIPPLSLLKNNIQPDDWVVLELANFQLIDLRHSPIIGVCLMVEAEHLDWHKDVAEYITAKQQLFRWQTLDDLAIYYELNNNSRHVVSISAGLKTPYFAKPGAVVEDGEIRIEDQTICHTDELQLLGEHNWQNICAAVTATWQVTQDVNAIRSVAISFTGLAHRLEFVREINGVSYYDDSFGTTPSTAQVAMAAFSQPKIIILGGSDKGASYDALAATVASSNVRHALLIGNQAKKIGLALDSAGFTEYSPGGGSMTEIVQQAHSLSLPGDVVLLSTACASFDMFKNYKDRAEQFKKAVLELASTDE